MVAKRVLTFEEIYQQKLEKEQKEKDRESEYKQSQASASNKALSPSRQKNAF
jgi:hypothetical protein